MKELRRNRVKYFWLIWILIAGFAHAEIRLVLDVRNDPGEIEQSRLRLQQLLGQDTSLAELSKRLGFRSVVRREGKSYLLTSTPLPENEAAAALYWKLRTAFPGSVAVPLSPTGSLPSGVPSLPTTPNPEKTPSQEWMLWIALFAMAVTGVLGLFFTSRQVNRLQERHSRIKRQQEEIEKRVHELFSRLGEEIYQLGRDVTDQTHRLKEQAPEPHLEHRLDEVIEMENRIVESATNLLGFLKLKARNVTIEETEFNLNKMLDAVTEVVASEVEEIDSELIFEMDKNLPRTVRGDFTHMVEMLGKLLEYALRAATGGQVRLRLDANRPYEGGVDLQMRLYFMPAEEEDLRNFFAPIYDEKTGEYRRLGLYVASELAELLGGVIHAYRPSSKGELLIDLSIPLKPVNDQEQRKYHLPEREFIKKDVLIVNQNYEASLALKEMFSYFRHRVTVMEAEKRPNLEQYDLLLIDEDLLGHMMAEHIRETKEDKDLKVVALHNLFQAPRESIAEDIVDRRVNRPMNQQRVFELILDLYSSEMPRKEPMEREEQPPVKQFVRSYREKETVSLEDFRRFAGAKLLIVEDNEINLRMLMKILEGSGIEVTTAHHGGEAVEKVQTLPPGTFDLVLMDINMPVMDGYEATEAIRWMPQGKSLPIVALSALNVESEIDQMEKVGMDGFLEKPMRLGKLYTLFEEYLPQDGTKEPESRAVTVETPKGIDWEIALANANGSEVLLEELLQGFVDAYRDTGKLILESYAKEDEAALRQIFLDLLGLSGSLGATELHRNAKAIYRDLMYGKLEEIEEKIRRYVRIHEALVDSLENYLKSVRSSVGGS